MIYDSNKHHRRSIRMKGYDYGQAGAYFVTICTQNRECLFGAIIDEEMQLNAAGNTVQLWWNRLPEKYVNVKLDECIIMPNNFHGIIIINDYNDRRGEVTSPYICPYPNPHWVK